jgi:hypothetical protein
MTGAADFGSVLRIIFTLPTVANTMTYVSLRDLKLLIRCMRLPTETILSSMLIACVTFIVPATSLADANSTKRMAEFAKLPNWTGVWESIPNSTAQNDPQFNATWLQKHTPKKPAVEPVDNAISRCVWGMPRLLKSAHEFEVAVLPEQTFFSYDINEFRHVWTDGRKHLMHITPANTGYSIGHWEGATLVVDTTGIHAGLWISHKGGILSPHAVIQERWSQPDTDHLKVDVTIHDTTSLAKPFAFTRRFQRMADTNRLTHKQCFEESRDQNKDVEY